MLIIVITPLGVILLFFKSGSKKVKIDKQMKFSEVIGQENLKKLLINSVRDNRISHAQMFNGKIGYGSLALALAYSQYILCENPSPTDSCGVCPACYKAQRLEHPDLHFVFPVNKSDLAKTKSSSGDIISDSFIDSWRTIITNQKGYIGEQEWYNYIQLGKNSQGSISKAEAYEIIKLFSFKSYEGGYKILIIWLPERMNDTTANKLLKLFEEPAPDTLFLFVSENSDSIIKTIISRTQPFNIPPIQTSDLRDYLISVGVSDTLSHTISHISSGDLKRALYMVENSSETSDNFDYFSSLMRLCFSVNHIGLIDWSENMASLPREVQKGFVNYSLNILRDSYMMHIGLQRVTYAYGVEAEFLNKFYLFVHHQNIEKLISEFERVALDLNFNGNPKIIFIHFALSISKLIKRNA